MRVALSRRSLAWLLATALLLAVGGGLFFQSRPPGLDDAASGPRFDLQGHRGARGRLTENSLPAFRHALETGVTTLEMDLRITADGVVVVHHDARLDPARTRSPDGTWIAAPGPAIADLTLAQLQTYDIGRARPGSRIAERFPGQAALDGVRVPSLRQVVRMAEVASDHAIRYNLETKLTPRDGPGAPAPADFAAAVLRVVRQTGVAARTTIQSFDWRTLAAVRRQAPAVSRAYLTAERDWLDNVARGEDGASPWLDGLDVDRFSASLPRTIAAAESGEATKLEALPPWRAVWSPYFRDLRAVDLQDAHALGLKVVVWTVNDSDTMASLIDLGVDGIITDYPARLRRVMANRGLPLPPAFAPPE